MHDALIVTATTAFCSSRRTNRLAGKLKVARTAGSPPEEQTMTTAQELEKKLWKAIDSDRTMMLGLEGVQGGHARPMTAQVEHDH